MEKIKIENFKKIKDECELDLAPITFLTGTNNSGKSTIIKATLLLQDYFRSNDLFNLNFNGNHKEKHGINSVNDILNNSNKIDEKYNSSFTTENASSKITISTKKGRIEELLIQNKKDNTDFTLKRNIHDVEESWDYKFNFNPNDNNPSGLKSNALEELETQIDSLKTKLKDQIILNKQAKIDIQKNRVKIGKLVQDTIREILLDFPNGKASKIENLNLLGFMMSENDYLKCKTFSEFEKFLKKVYDGDGFTPDIYTKEGSKEILNLNYPMLMPIPRNIPEEIIHNLSHDDKGKRRYYKEVFKSGGDFDYLLTNDWYEKSRPHYIEWLKEINYRGLKYIDDAQYSFHELNQKINKEEEGEAQRFYDETRLKGEIDNLEEKLKSMKIFQESIPDNSNKIECIEGNIPQVYINYSMQASFITGDTPKLILFEDIKSNVLKKFDRNDIAHGKVDLKKINTKIDSNFRNALEHKVYHLSTNRYNGKKYQIGNEVKCELDDLLIHKSVGQHKNFIEKWMSSKYFNIGYSFEISKLKPKEENVQLGNYIKIFKSKDKKDFEYLSDQGYGSGQIFTILYKIGSIINENLYNIIIEGNFKDGGIKSELNTKNVTLIIEEPETNLHPKLQSKLAELFYEVNKKYGIRFIIETHSEYLIRKTESIAHREKLYSYDDSNILPKEFPFKVIYLSKEGVKDMEYLNGGGFKNEFGSGFFDEATNIELDNMKFE